MVTLTLSPDLGFPRWKSHKFKVPDFQKYDRTGDRELHLTMYSHKMADHVSNEPLLISFFLDNLTGPTAMWFLKLKKVTKWKDLAQAFIQQYIHNHELAPDPTDLQRMRKKSDESFKEYAQRWRETVLI